VNDKTRRMQFIAELAKSFHARVTLFHMFVAHEAQAMPEGISQFLEQLALQEIAVSVRRGSGSLGRTITVEAITRHNDLIVLGASGRGLLRRLFYGNLAGDLLLRPPCNTILFRAAP
jgi:nucleotide-binding universal stress UspA family protein